MDDPPPLQARVPDLPPEVVSIVHQCLRKRAAERPESAGEVAAVLSGHLTEPDGQRNRTGSLPRVRTDPALAMTTPAPGSWGGLQGLLGETALETPGLSRTGPNTPAPLVRPGPFARTGPPPRGSTTQPPIGMLETQDAAMAATTFERPGPRAASAATTERAPRRGRLALWLAGGLLLLGSGAGAAFWLSRPAAPPPPPVATPAPAPRPSAPAPPVAAPVPPVAAPQPSEPAALAETADPARPAPERKRKPRPRVRTGGEPRRVEAPPPAPKPAPKKGLIDTL